MEKKKLSHIDFRKYREYYPSNSFFDDIYHMESILYFNEDVLLKLLYESILSKNRIITLDNLDKINNNDCAKIYDLIESFDGRIGYTMKRYKNHKTLKYYIKRFNKRNITFNERKKLIYRLNDIFEYFLSIGFIYYDIHINNILMLDESIKVVDLDSGIFEDKAVFTSNSYYSSIDEYKKEMLNNAIHLYLQILTGYSSYIKKDILDNKMIDSLDDKILFLLNHALYLDYNMCSPIQVIDSLKEENIDDVRKIILKY